MAHQQAPDDIFALYSRFDLDVSQYQVFERGLVNVLDVDQPAPATRKTEQPPVAIASPADAINLHVKAPQRSIGGAEREPDSARGSITDRAGLRSLLINLHQLNDRPRSDHSGLPCHPITICGSSGGVGVTTVMGTLAKQLAKQGLRCGLYDKADESLLPYFFGFHRIAAHPSRFAGLSAVLEPAVRLLGPGNIPSDSTSQPSSSALRQRALHAHENELDFFLADEGHSVAEIPQGITLFVALPDLSSVANIRSLINRTGWRGKHEDTICVLNRFDPDFALHQELLTWYRQQFAHVITIHHSNLVPESLAEGTSVVEMAPESQVTADFSSLASLVRRVAAERIATLKRSEGHSTQLEGLALCS